MEAYADLHEDSVPTCDSYDEYSQQHWQDRTAAVTDEFIRLKYQLETLQREKERDASMIASLKHVRYQNTLPYLSFVDHFHFISRLNVSISYQSSHSMMKLTLMHKLRS